MLSGLSMQQGKVNSATWSMNSPMPLAAAIHRQPASVVYNGGHDGDYRGYRLGVSDGMCIVRQLNFQPVILRYFRTQPISSVFVRDFARWPETPTVDRGMTNPCCFRTDSMEPSLSLDLAMVPRTHRRLIYQEPLACLRPRFMRNTSSLGRDDDLG